MPEVTLDRFRELARLRALKKDTEDAAKAAKEAHDRFQAELFADMQSTGHDSSKVDGVRFDRKSTIYGHVQDMAAFEAWCAEFPERAETFLKTSPEKARINERVREAIDNGEELPPGVGFYARDYISITQS